MTRNKKIMTVLVVLALCIAAIVIALSLKPKEEPKQAPQDFIEQTDKSEIVPTETQEAENPQESEKQENKSADEFEELQKDVLPENVPWGDGMELPEIDIG